MTGIPLKYYQDIVHFHIDSLGCLVILDEELEIEKECRFLRIYEHKLTRKRIQIADTSAQNMGYDAIFDHKQLTAVTSSIKRLILGKSSQMIFYADIDERRETTIYSIWGLTHKDGHLHIEHYNINRKVVYSIQLGVTNGKIKAVAWEGDLLGYSADCIVSEVVEILRKACYLPQVIELLSKTENVTMKDEDPDVNFYLLDIEQQTGIDVQFTIRVSKKRKLKVLLDFYKAYSIVDDIMDLSKMPPLKKLVFTSKSSTYGGQYFRVRDLIEIPLQTAEADLLRYTSVLLHEYTHKAMYCFLAKDNPHREYNKSLVSKYIHMMRVRGQYGLIPSVYDYYRRNALTATPKFIQYLSKVDEIICRGMQTYLQNEHYNVEIEYLKPEAETRRRSEILLTEWELSVVMELLSLLKFEHE